MVSALDIKYSDHVDQTPNDCVKMHNFMPCLTYKGRNNLPIVNPCFFWVGESFNTWHRSSTIAPTGSEVCIKSQKFGLSFKSNTS